MSTRVIHRASTFDRDLKQLSKNHHHLEKAVLKKLDELTSANDPSCDGPLGGCAGLPVFKVRIAHGNSGKRGAARMVYYWNEALVMPFFLYLKNDISGIPEKALLGALRDAGLVPEDEQPAKK